MKTRIEPYSRKSKSAKRLAKSLGVLIKTPQQVRKHGHFDLILNWGCSTRSFNGEYLNRPEAVADACNKLESARAFEQRGVPSPAFTTDRDEAIEWARDGSTIVCRQLLCASQGRGIVLVDPEHAEDMPRAPLYTKYCKKADEYRVHIFHGEAIDVQQKRKRRVVNNDEVNYQIRNARFGWVFCRGGVDAPASVLRAARDAVSALGLDFGGVDIGYAVRSGTPTVYEVNTAPGIEGSTLEAYTKAILDNYPHLRGGAYARRRAHA